MEQINLSVSFSLFYMLPRSPCPRGCPLLRLLTAASAVHLGVMLDEETLLLRPCCSDPALSALPAHHLCRDPQKAKSTPIPA